MVEILTVFRTKSQNSRLAYETHIGIEYNIQGLKNNHLRQNSSWIDKQKFTVVITLMGFISFFSNFLNYINLLEVLSVLTLKRFTLWYFTCMNFYNGAYTPNLAPNVNSLIWNPPAHLTQMWTKILPSHSMKPGEVGKYMSLFTSFQLLSTEHISV